MFFSRRFVNQQNTNEVSRARKSYPKAGTAMAAVRSAEVPDEHNSLLYKPLSSAEPTKDALSKDIDKAANNKFDTKTLIKLTDIAKGQHGALLEKLNEVDVNLMPYAKREALRKLLRNAFRSRMRAVSAAERKAMEILAPRAKRHGLKKWQGPSLAESNKESVSKVKAGSYDLVSELFDGSVPSATTSDAGADGYYRPWYMSDPASLDKYSKVDIKKDIAAFKAEQLRQKKVLQEEIKYYLAHAVKQQASFKTMYGDFDQVEAPSFAGNVNPFAVVAFVRDFDKKAKAHLAKKHEELVGKDGKGGKYNAVKEKLSGIYPGYRFSVAEIDSIKPLSKDFSMKDAQIVRNRIDLLNEKAKEQFDEIVKRLKSDALEEVKKESTLAKMAIKGYPEAIALLAKVKSHSSLDFSKVQGLDKIMEKSTLVKGLFVDLKMTKSRIEKIGTGESMIAFYLKNVETIKDPEGALKYYNNIVEKSLRDNKLLADAIRSRLKQPATKFLEKAGDKYFLDAAKEAGEDITADPVAVNNKLKAALKNAFQESFSGVDLPDNLLEGVLSRVDAKKFTNPKEAKDYFASHFVVPENGQEADKNSQIFLGLDTLKHVYGSRVRKKEFSEAEMKRLAEEYKDKPLELQKHALKAVKLAIRANNNKLQRFFAKSFKGHLKKEEGRSPFLPMEFDLVTAHKYEMAKPESVDVVKVESAEEKEKISPSKVKHNLILKVAKMAGDTKLEKQLTELGEDPDYSGMKPSEKRATIKARRKLKRAIGLKTKTLMAFVGKELGPKGALTMSIRSNEEHERWSTEIPKDPSTDQIIAHLIEKFGNKGFQIGLKFKGGRDALVAKFEKIGKTNKAKRQYIRSYKRAVAKAARVRAKEAIAAAKAAAPNRPTRRAGTTKSRGHYSTPGKTVAGKRPVYRSKPRTGTEGAVEGTSRRSKRRPKPRATARDNSPQKETTANKETAEEAETQKAQDALKRLTSNPKSIEDRTTVLDHLLTKNKSEANYRLTDEASTLTLDGSKGDKAILKVDSLNKNLLSGLKETADKDFKGKFDVRKDDV